MQGDYGSGGPLDALRIAEPKKMTDAGRECRTVTSNPLFRGVELDCRGPRFSPVEHCDRWGNLI